MAEVESVQAVGGVRDTAAGRESADNRLEIRISGSGGQGILLAGAVLADAVAAAGREVVQTQSYGPEARGGASQVELIAATEPIDYPEVDLADISLCLSQAALDRYGRKTRPGGLLLYDSDLVDEGEVAGARLLGLPFTKTATGGLGARVVANMVALGALSAFIPWLPSTVIAEAIVARVPEHLADLDLRALEAGRRLVELAEAGVGIEGAEMHAEGAGAATRAGGAARLAGGAGAPLAVGPPPGGAAAASTSGPDASPAPGPAACEPCGDEH